MSNKLTLYLYLGVRLTINTYCLAPERRYKLRTCPASASNIRVITGTLLMLFVKVPIEVLQLYTLFHHHVVALPDPHSRKQSEYGVLPPPDHLFSKERVNKDMQ